MHLVESFALSTALKIDEPYIYEAYTPLPMQAERYISFQPWGQKEYDARIYPYWGEVLDILRPSLNKADIPIVQIGSAKEDKVQGTLDMRGKTSINQAAYIIKNAELHLGIDSFGVHFASGYRKKIVALYSNMLPEQSGPYWGDEKDTRILSSVKENEKASYVQYEDPKTILRINPEDVAEAVCDLLGLDYDYPYKTIGSGEEYSFKRVEIIPNNFVSNWNQFGLDSAIMRMDKFDDQQVLVEQLKVCPCSVIADKPINLQILHAFKDKIVEMVYFIDESTDVGYIEQLKNTGVKLYLICKLSEEKLNKIKLNYLDVAPIIHQPVVTKKDVMKKYGIKNLDNVYFKSSMSIVNENGLFSNYAHAQANQSPISNHRFMDPLPVLDTPDFWQDSHRMTFLVKKS